MNHVPGVRRYQRLEEVKAQETERTGSSDGDREKINPQRCARLWVPMVFVHCACHETGLSMWPR